MGTVRFFSGGRDQVSKKSIAQEILRFEVQKKAKLDPQERFKFIMKRKLEESRKKVQQSKAENSSRPMSARAEKALKDIAAKKAAKQQKELRRMVIVQPKTFSNGRLTKKGDIFDIAGNKVGKVNTKDGKMNTYLGTFLGHYKPKSHRTISIIQNSIDQYSPYFINMRKMQAMQAAGLDPRTGQPLNPDNSNVYGSIGGNSYGSTLYGGGSSNADESNGGGNSAYAMHGGLYRPLGSERFRREQQAAMDNDLYGDGANGITRGSSIGATVHGTASNNVWGNYADNAWGTSFDNVLGTNNQDVWGQATGNPYGSFGKSVQMFGTGNGVNHIKSLINRLSQLFGLNSKSTRLQIKAARAGSSAGPRPSAGGPRQAGPRPSAGPRPTAGPRPSAPVGRR